MTSATGPRPDRPLIGFPYDNRWGWTPQTLLDDTPPLRDVPHMHGHLPRCPDGGYDPSRRSADRGPLTELIGQLDNCCRTIEMIGKACSIGLLDTFVDLHDDATTLDQIAELETSANTQSHRTDRGTDVVQELLGIAGRLFDVADHPIPDPWRHHVVEQAHRLDRQLTRAAPDWRRARLHQGIACEVRPLVNVAQLTITTALSKAGLPLTVAYDIAASVGHWDDFEHVSEHATLEDNLVALLTELGLTTDDLTENVSVVCNNAVDEFARIVGRTCGPQTGRNVMLVTTGNAASFARTYDHVSTTELIEGTPVLMPSALAETLADDAYMVDLGVAPDGFAALPAPTRREMVDCARTALEPSSPITWALAIRLAGDTLDVDLDTPGSGT